MNGGGAAEEEEMKPTKRVAMSRAVVEHFRAFADGSGTDCIVSCAGFRFSFNTLGEGKVTRHGIGGRSSDYTRDVRGAAEKAQAAYIAHRDQALTTEWFRLNAEMYA